MNEILLKQATRDQLIEELKSRKSITHVQINKDEGANITHKYGRLAVDGLAHIFVVKEEESVTEKCEEPNHGNHTEIGIELLYRPDNIQALFELAKQNYLKELEKFCEILNKYTFEPDWSSDEKNFYIAYDNETNEISVGETSYIQENVPYFKSPEDAFRFVNEVGENCVKKFMCNTWK